jgi:hypothetical protein
MYIYSVVLLLCSICIYDTMSCTSVSIRYTNYIAVYLYCNSFFTEVYWKPWSMTNITNTYKDTTWIKRLETVQYLVAYYKHNIAKQIPHLYCYIYQEYYKSCTLQMHTCASLPCTVVELASTMYAGVFVTATAVCSIQMADVFHTYIYCILCDFARKSKIQENSRLPAQCV